jgi:hypothetical protein
MGSIGSNIECLDGTFLSKRNTQFIKVRVYYCKSQRHVFEIPDSFALQSAYDMQYLKSLTSGKCPECGPSFGKSPSGI